ncbi:hypothetical protein B0O99DRAFT_620863 [Bisporella sp. PMI_857]|nr:hypothetical protein B0O99DRAFT_620863 [Bisporella sp. PMI_857]
MLAPYFQKDPFGPYDSAAALHRTKRAFHQQDCLNQGYLSRVEVVQVCEEVLHRAGIRDNSSTGLESMITAFDANKDGQFDDEEFVMAINKHIEVASNEWIKQLWRIL